MTIKVEQHSESQPIKVTKLVKAINHYGVVMYVTERQMRNAEELGLSLRRVK